MIIGTTLHQGIDAFTDWFERPAHNAFFTVLLIATSETNADLEFEVFHKNRDQEGQGTSASSTQTIEGTDTLPKPESINATGLKELIRIRLKVKNGAATTAWAHFLVLNPSPYDSAN